MFKTRSLNKQTNQQMNLKKGKRRNHDLMVEGIEGRASPFGR